MPRNTEVGSRALSVVRKYFPKVKKVNDADAPLTVEVTGRDAAAGARKSHPECAMAVACKRTQHADGVVMSVRTAYIIKGDTATRPVDANIVGMLRKLTTSVGVWVRLGRSSLELYIRSADEPGAVLMQEFDLFELDARI